MPATTAKARDLEEAFLSEVSVENIYRHAEVFSEGIGRRLPASAQEYNAVVYIKKVLESYGLPVEVDSLDAFVDRDIFASLEVLTPERRHILCESLGWSASTDDTGITAPLVFVGLGSHDEVRGKDLTGKIALVRSGKVWRGGKLRNVQEAGARGMIMFGGFSGHFINNLGSVSLHFGNPTENTVFPKVPAAVVSYDDGEWLLAQVTKREVTVRFGVRRDRVWLPSHNLVATLKGSRFPDEEVWSGAHLDNWGPGAWDSGAQLAGMLEIARVATKFRDRIGRSLKFGAFGAHECGLVGCYDFAFGKRKKEIQERAVFYLNHVPFINARGIKKTGLLTQSSPEADDFVERVIRDLGFDKGWRTNYALWDMSDHIPFILNGVSVCQQRGWLECYQNPYWHSNGADTYRNLDLEDHDYVRNYMTKLNSALLLRLANAPLLPFNFSRWGEVFERELKGIQTRLANKADFASLVELSAEYQRRAAALRTAIEHAREACEARPLRGDPAVRLDALLGSFNRAYLQQSRTIISTLYNPDVNRRGELLIEYPEDDLGMLQNVMQYVNQFTRGANWEGVRDEVDREKGRLQDMFRRNLDGLSMLSQQLDDIRKLIG
ncbi:MAG: M28 family peptidase [Candidatus Rokubacteria bacterium]|nr:M28 family peptidase [Candidatus Rokubacteria bacterium]